ncbi:MAG TPA: 2OG-Fe(II) oxygenase [Stellaceae bacterium]|nr:2OG-Fe(II) oxygenase [Stellaceae bacterium]
MPLPRHPDESRDPSPSWAPAFAGVANEEGAGTPALAIALDRDGYAVLPGLLGADECRELTALYDERERFRSRVVMARHGYGQGEYKYFTYPLPPLVGELRQMLYPLLAPLANRWQRQLGREAAFPATLDDYLARCHAAGQQRPTPLILKYGPGDYNCLHQDLYGELVFPIQATVLLSRPGEDFAGGEFLLVEQRPRRQSKGEVVALRQGDTVIFPVNHRPVSGARGYYRATMRHGVSRVHSGSRFTLGIIFHDAA